MSGLEGLSIGANVIGVVAFGLQAAKFIAESVSKFQEAEEEQKGFLDTIQRLARVLTDVNEILQSDADKLRYSSLKNTARNCEDELVNIQKKILGWNNPKTGQKSKAVKTWKRFKTAILEDNCKSLVDKLEGYYGFINFQLNKIQLHTVRRIEANLDNVSHMVSTVSDTQAKTFVRIDAIEDTVTQQLQTNLSAVEDLNTCVGANFNYMNGTLGSIDTNVKLFAQTQFHRAAEEREKDEIEKATGRILQLGPAAVTRPEATIRHEQKEQVLQDIQKWLSFAKKGNYSELLVRTPGSGERGQQKNRKLAGMILSSDCLEIGYDNTVIKSFKSHKSRFSVTEVIQWEQEDFYLRVAESTKYNSRGTNANLAQRMTKLTYIPKTMGFGSIVDVSLAQSEVAGTPLYVGLTFRTILPPDAEIYPAIFYGDVDAVCRLVSTKQVGINDCDSLGMNLLMTSLIRAEDRYPAEYTEEDRKLLARRRLEISKYLISQGSDVTHIDNENYDPLSSAKDWSNSAAVNLLLENGANPIIRSINVVTFAFELTESSWKQFLEQVYEFYSINDCISWYGSVPMPLLVFILNVHAIHDIWNTPMGFVKPLYDIKEVVRKLISSGADPTSTTPDGQNCLYVVFHAIEVPEAKPTEDKLGLLKDLLLFLVTEIGIDVRGRTSFGYTVSDMAFFAQDNWDIGIWSVWAEVLEESGYNPLEIAEGSHYFQNIKSLVDGQRRSTLPFETSIAPDVIFNTEPVIADAPIANLWQHISYPVNKKDESGQFISEIDHDLRSGCSTASEILEADHPAKLQPQSRDMSPIDTYINFKESIQPIHSMIENVPTFHDNMISKWASVLLGDEEF